MLVLDTPTNEVKAKINQETAPQSQLCLPPYTCSPNHIYKTISTSTKLYLQSYIYETISAKLCL